MEKKMTLGEVMAISQFLIANWDQQKSEIKLGGRAVYALIKLKNNLMDEFKKAQEATRTIVMAHGGVEQDDGSIKVPDNEIGPANAELNELQREEVKIDYIPIPLGESDSLPLDFMDALFEFIEMK